MEDYTYLLQDVSYHSSGNLCVPRFQETVCEYFNVVVGLLSLQLEIYFFSFVVKSILKHFAAILLYTKTT